MSSQLAFDAALSDSPAFWEAYNKQEQAADDLDTWIKQLVKDAKSMNHKGQSYNKLVEAFAQHLERCPQEWEAEDEKDMPNITSVFEAFGKTLLQIEAQRIKTLNWFSREFVIPLENYRRESSEKLKERRRQFNRSCKSYRAALDTSCAASAKKPEIMMDKDQELDQAKHDWIRNSLTYVQTINETTAQRKLTLGSQLCSLISSELEFGNDYHAILESRLRPELNVLNDWVTTAKSKFREDQEASIRSMREAEAHAIGAFRKAHSGTRLSSPEAPNDGVDVSVGTWLYLKGRSKAGLGVQWMRTWCKSEGDQFIAVNSDMTPPEGIRVQSCCHIDRFQTDRRNCFEVNSQETSILCQALSDSDRSAWMSALGSVFTPAKSMRKRSKEIGSVMEIERGFAFLKGCLTYIEANYILEPGLYRTGGQKSKMIMLYEKAVKKNRHMPLDEEDQLTVTSCLKYFLREMLPEPVVPDDDSRTDWFDAIQLESQSELENALKNCVLKLPGANQKILVAVIAHLSKVAEHADKNKMQSSNLGVVFGPTLLWSVEDHALSQISSCNKVVECLIDNYKAIFEELEDKLRTRGTRLQSSNSTDSLGESRDNAKKPPAPTPPPKNTKPILQLTESPAEKTFSLIGESSDSLEVGDDSTNKSTDSKTGIISLGSPVRDSVIDIETEPDTNEEKSDEVSNESSANKIENDEEYASSTDDVPNADPVPPVNRALFHCSGADEEELSFNAGDLLIDCEETDEEGWWQGTLKRTGERGLFPNNYCVPVDDDKEKRDSLLV
eukprot:m.260822 g.260822  ORF g.260822 m.260822 type:complete len:783 (-) comp16215_c0_seq1:4958-7306(-)